MRSKSAAQLMSTNLVTILPDARLTDALGIMIKRNVSCLPVIDTNERFLGVITEYDILNSALSGEAHNTFVHESMTTNAITFAPDDSLEKVVNTCESKRLHRAPVVDNGRLVGIISRRDILREMLVIYQKL